MQVRYIDGCMKGIGPNFDTSWCVGDPNFGTTNQADGAAWFLTDSKFQKIVVGEAGTANAARKHMYSWTR